MFLIMRSYMWCKWISEANLLFNDRVWLLPTVSMAHVELSDLRVSSLSSFRGKHGERSRPKRLETTIDSWNKPTSRVEQENPMKGEPTGTKDA